MAPKRGPCIVYLDDQNLQDYSTTFHEKLDMDSTWDKPVLAIVLRGIDANKKICMVECFNFVSDFNFLYMITLQKLTRIKSQI